jgi:hypothetical protein
LHAVGHFLNLRFFYKDHTIEHDEVTCGLYKCFENLLSKNDQEKAMDKLLLVTKAKGQFVINLTIKSRDTTSPSKPYISIIKI